MRDMQLRVRPDMPCQRLADAHAVRLAAMMRRSRSTPSHGRFRCIIRWQLAQTITGLAADELTFTS